MWLPMWGHQCVVTDVLSPMWVADVGSITQCGIADVWLPMWGRQCGVVNVGSLMLGCPCEIANVRLLMCGRRCGVDHVQSLMWYCEGREDVVILGPLLGYALCGELCLHL